MLIFASIFALAISQAGSLSSTAAPIMSCSDPSIKPPVPLTQPTAQSYPPQAVRMAEEGATVVAFIVDDTGNTSAPAIEQSSGYSDLDAASIVSANGRRYQPATLAGKPVACRNQMRIIWKLTDDEQALAGINIREMGAADYPASAKANKEEGVAFVVVMLDENGKIVNSAVIKSSGYGDLDAASLDRIYAEHDIAPARFFGKAMKTGLIFAFRWSLGNSK